MQPNDLIIALDKLSKLNIPKAGKDRIGEILRAASNPDAERPEVVVASLPDARRKLIGKTAARVRGVTKGVMARGRERLMGMSASEWNKLVDDE